MHTCVCDAQRNLHISGNCVYVRYYGMHFFITGCYFCFSTWIVELDYYIMKGGGAKKYLLLPTFWTIFGRSNVCIVMAFLFLLEFFCLIGQSESYIFFFFELTSSSTKSSPAVSVPSGNWAQDVSFWGTHGSLSPSFYPFLFFHLLDKNLRDIRKFPLHSLHYTSLSGTLSPRCAPQSRMSLRAPCWSVSGDAKIMASKMLFCFSGAGGHKKRWTARWRHVAFERCMMLQ